MLNLGATVGVLLTPVFNATWFDVKSWSADPYGRNANPVKR